MPSPMEAALTRSIRMKRPEDALYWLSRLQSAGTGKKKLANLLFVTSLRDNLDIKLMVECEAATLSPDSANLTDLAQQLALTEKLWSVDIGRNLIKVVKSASRAIPRFRQNSDSEILSRLDDAMNFEDRFLEVSYLVVEIWSRYEMNQKDSAFFRLIDQLGIRARGTDVETAVWILDRYIRQRGPNLSQETLLWLCVAWLVTGTWGQWDGLIPSLNQIAMAGRIEHEEPIPDWAAPEDRRFEVTWPGYENMGAMLEQYGRLDPDDEGITLRTKGGIWKPVIKEERGCYMIQSERDQFHYYEVNLAVMSCSCKSFEVRKQPCKHVRIAKEFAESQMPFEVR